MTKQHMTEDGLKRCDAKTPASCRAVYRGLEGENVPHFSSKSEGLAWIENDAAKEAEALTGSSAKVSTLRKQREKKKAPIQGPFASRAEEIAAIRAQITEWIDEVSNATPDFNAPWTEEWGNIENLDPRIAAAFQKEFRKQRPGSVKADWKRRDVPPGYLNIQDSVKDIGVDPYISPTDMNVMETWATRGNCIFYGMVQEARNPEAKGVIISGDYCGTHQFLHYATQWNDGSYSDAAGSYADPQEIFADQKYGQKTIELFDSESEEGSKLLAFDNMKFYYGSFTVALCMFWQDQQ